MSKKEETQKYISVVARPASGFRRAGYEFAADKPTVIELAKLSKEQLAQIKKEPNLVVVETGGEPAPAKASEDVDALKTQLADLQKQLTASEGAEKAAQAELKETQDKLAEVQKQLAAEKDQPKSKTGSGKTNK